MSGWPGRLWRIKAHGTPWCILEGQGVSGQFAGLYLAVIHTALLAHGSNYSKPDQPFLTGYAMNEFIVLNCIQNITEPLILFAHALVST